MPERRFPAPWRIERLPGGYRVADGTGVALAYVYCRADPSGGNDQSLTPDEARRIAAQIARLPGLLGGKWPITAEENRGWEDASIGVCHPPPWPLEEEYHRGQHDYERWCDEQR